MTTQLKFSPKLPGGLVFSGEVSFGGANLNFISMDANTATIDNIPASQLAEAMEALAGALQVSIEVSSPLGVESFSAQGSEPEPERTPKETVDNVFELDFETLLDTPIPLGGTMAEVVPIKPVVPDNVSLWETLFAKPEAVREMSVWSSSPDSNDYIYIPNDLSKVEGEQENFAKNAAFTSIMLDAYKQACKWKELDPSITLATGQGPYKVLSLVPLDASQPNVYNEKASRLANSTVDMDDSFLVPAFLTCIRAMGPDDYDSPVAHLTVLAKTEVALTGSSSLVTNFTVIKNLCEFAEKDFARSGSFMEGNTTILNAILFTLRQMVLEDRILHSSKGHFMACMHRAGLAEFNPFLDRAYEDACSCR
jgi:hypothetical protein